MFIKVVNENVAHIYEAAENVEYGLKWVNTSPGDPTFDLRDIGPSYNYAYVLFEGADKPTGYYHFAQPNMEDEGKPYWKVSWAFWIAPEGTDTAVFTVGDMYILANNGKTLDKVK